MKAALKAAAVVIVGFCTFPLGTSDAKAQDEGGNWEYWYQCNYVVIYDTHRVRSDEPNAWASGTHGWIPELCDAHFNYGGGGGPD